MKGVFRYIKKYHQWIIGTLIALLGLVAPFAILYLQELGAQNSRTATYYFAGSYTGDINSLTEADCWISSMASRRPDAFRCMSGNTIYDPCFDDPSNADVLVCPFKPTDEIKYFKKVLEKDFENLNGTESNPKMTDNDPWYIKLSNGSECYFLTGATDLVAGMRYDYECSSGKQTQMLLLPIHQNGSLMSIGCLEKGKIANCDVREAWY